MLVLLPQQRFVYATLHTLGLLDIAHSLIGDEESRGISGGQRKRVNIGMELVADPTVRHTLHVWTLRSRQQQCHSRDNGCGW